MTERRLTAEREAEIRQWCEHWTFRGYKLLKSDEFLAAVLAELDAVRAERDEALKQLEILRKQHGVGLAGMNFITNRERGSR